MASRREDFGQLDRRRDAPRGPPPLSSGPGRSSSPMHRPKGPPGKGMDVDPIMPSASGDQTGMLGRRRRRKQHRGYSVTRSRAGIGDLLDRVFGHFSPAIEPEAVGRPRSRGRRLPVRRIDIRANNAAICAETDRCESSGADHGAQVAHEDMREEFRLQLPSMSCSRLTVTAGPPADGIAGGAGIGAAAFRTQRADRWDSWRPIRRKADRGRPHAATSVP